MTSPTTDRVRSPQRSRVLGLAPGLAIVALFTGIDVGARPTTAVIGFILVAPLVTALAGTWRDVATVGAVCVVIAALSGIWRHNLGEGAHFYRIFLVTTASVLAYLTARSRGQVTRDRERFAILSAVAEIADGTRSLADTVAGLNDIVVPAIADICIVDAMSKGELQRLAVRVAGDGGGTRRGVARRAPAVDRSTRSGTPRNRGCWHASTTAPSRRSPPTTTTTGGCARSA